MPKANQSVTITAEHALHLERLLRAFCEADPDFLFKWWCIQQFPTFQAISDRVKKENQVSPEVVEYEQKRTEICQQYAVRDGEGKPIVTGGEYRIDPSQYDEVTRQLSALKSQYTDALEKHNATIHTVMEKLRTEKVHVAARPLTQVELPSQVSFELWQYLQPFIDDSSEVVDTASPEGADG